MLLYLSPIAGAVVRHQHSLSASLRDDSPTPINVYALKRRPMLMS